MDNVQRERRSRKRERKRPRSASSSSENLDESVSRSSSHRHKPKRRRRHSTKRRRSKQRKDSRRKSKKRAPSQRNRSTGISRSVPVQINTALTPQTVQHRENSQRTSKTAAPATSTSFRAVPSTSSAHLVGPLPPMDNSPARRHKQVHESGGVRPSVYSRQAHAIDTERQTRKNNRSNVSEQSAPSQLLNMMTNADLENQNNRQSPAEEHSESELQCIICSELFIRPTMLNCKHTFCKYCIDMWKRYKEECPLCRTPITSESRTTRFDLMIEKVTQATEESKKQRLEIVREREELEAQLSRQPRQLEPPSPGFMRHWSDFDNSSESDNETNYDSDYGFNGNMVFTDVDGEDIYVDYTYNTDSGEEDAHDYIENITGDEDFYNGYTDNEENVNQDADELPSDFNGSASENEVYEISDDANSESNGSIDVSDNNDDGNINYDENVSNDEADVNNDNVDGDGYGIDGSEDDNAYEDVASDNSDDNVYDEASDDNEDDSDYAYEAHEDNIGSGNSDDNLDDETYEHNEDDGENTYEDNNGSGNSDGNVDYESHGDNGDGADSEENYYNSVDAYDCVSFNNSDDAYDENNYGNDSDARYDDNDYDYD